MREAVDQPVEDRPSGPEPFGHRLDVGVEASKDEAAVGLDPGEAAEVMDRDIEGLPVPVGVRDPYQLARIGEGPATNRAISLRGPSGPGRINC